jgi:hypothetical protein
MSCAERNRSRPREEINVPIVFALAATKKRSKKNHPEVLETQHRDPLQTSKEINGILNGVLKQTALNSQLTKRTSLG